MFSFETPQDRRSAAYSQRLPAGLFRLVCCSGVGGTYHPLRPFAPPSRLANLSDVLSRGGWFRVSLASPASVPEELRATTFAAVFLGRAGALSPTLHLLLPTCRLAALLGVRVLRAEPRPSAGVAVPGALLAALSLTGRTMLQIRREGNNASTWSNVMNALVGALPAFRKFFEELSFDQIGVSMAGARPYVARRGSARTRLGKGARPSPALVTRARRGSPGCFTPERERARLPGWEAGSRGCAGLVSPCSGPAPCRRPASPCARPSPSRSGPGRWSREPG